MMIHSRALIARTESHSTLFRSTDSRMPQTVKRQSKPISLLAEGVSVCAAPFMLTRNVSIFSAAVNYFLFSLEATNYVLVTYNKLLRKGFFGKRTPVPVWGQWLTLITLTWLYYRLAIADANMRR